MDPIILAIAIPLTILATLAWIEHVLEQDNMMKMEEQGVEKHDHAKKHHESGRVKTPWGYWVLLAGGERWQAKKLVINPGEETSLQTHMHRDERWTVVRGAADITLGDDYIMVYEGGSITVDVDEPHRIRNHGKIPLEIVEVQMGSYLGEDDIERLDDKYGRVDTPVTPR